MSKNFDTPNKASRVSGLKMNVRNLLSKGKQFNHLQGDVLEFIPMMLKQVIQKQLHSEKKVIEDLGKGTMLSKMFPDLNCWQKFVIPWGGVHLLLKDRVGSFSSQKEEDLLEILDAQEGVVRNDLAVFEEKFIAKARVIIDEYMKTGASKELLMFLFFYFSLVANKFGLKLKAHRILKSEQKLCLNKLASKVLSKGF